MHTNHRRKQKRDTNLREKFSDYAPKNGFAPAPNSRNSSFLDKSLHHWPRVSEYADCSVNNKSIGNDFTNGRRGMAKAVRGAKKFVRSRIRFAENQQLRKEIARLA